MNDIRKAVLQALAELSERYPSMRFGQIACMAAALASDDAHTEPGEIDDAALFQAARDHNSQSRTVHVARTSLSSERRHLLAVLASSGADRAELGKWLCVLAQQAQSNVYDVEDEQLLEALVKQQTVPVE